MKITLSAADADRLGCPREVEFDEGRLMAREAVAIQAQTGWRLEKLHRELNGKPVTDDEGNPVYLLDDMGFPELDEQGKQIQLRDINVEALLIAAWIAVRREVNIPYSEFDIDLLGSQFGEQQAAGEQGKA